MSEVDDRQREASKLLMNKLGVISLGTNSTVLYGSGVACEHSI